MIKLNLENLGNFLKTKRSKQRFFLFFFFVEHVRDEDSSPFLIPLQFLCMYVCPHTYTNTEVHFFVRSVPLGMCSLADFLPVITDALVGYVVKGCA